MTSHAVDNTSASNLVLLQQVASQSVPVASGDSVPLSAFIPLFAAHTSASAPGAIHARPIAFGIPYTLHPTPFTLHPAPFTIHPSPYTLHPTPYTLHPDLYTLHPTPCTLHPAPYTLHPTPCTLHHSPKTRNPKPETPNSKHLTLNSTHETLTNLNSLSYPTPQTLKQTTP